MTEKDINQWSELQISQLEECIMYSLIGSDGAKMNNKIVSLECSARAHHKLREFVKLSGYKLEFHPQTGLPKITPRS